MAGPYEQMGPTASQLGLQARAGTPGSLSPRPSMNMQAQEHDRFLAQQTPGSPYSQTQQLDPQGYEMSPPLSRQPRSYFDTPGHTAPVNPPTQWSDEKVPTDGRGRKSAAPFYSRAWFWILLAVLVVLGVAGGIIGRMMVNKHNHSGNSNGNSNSLGTQDDTSSGGTRTSGSAPPPSATPTITPLARYNWRDTSQAAYGVNTGNWLVLERWLDEDWFTSLCANCEDEWEWSAHLGANAIPTLQQHYDDYLKESDIDNMKSLGFNMIRVTIGYWAIIDTPGEPFVNAGQLDRLRTLMEWCHARQIYISISIHGLPGSQSGDQSTGRRKDWTVSGTAWFTANNQARSDQTIAAFATWITQQGPYSSVIASVLPVNEPKQTDETGQAVGNRQEMIKDYYRRSYKTLSNIGMVMSIHPGYLNGQDPTEWEAFIKAETMDPNLVIWETHPYPGYFPLRTDADEIMNSVCSLAEIHNQISVPVYFGEFSALSGVTDSGWLRRYWNSQLAAYTSSAGSAFWTWNSKNSSNPIRALSSSQMSRYDFQFLLNQGIVTRPAAGQSIKDFVNSLPHNQCSNQRKRKVEREARLNHREVRKARLPSLASH